MTSALLGRLEVEENGSVTFDRSGALPLSRDGRPLTDIRGALKSLTEAAGIKKHVTPHVLRHTYGSVRIQTLDRGEPVALFTVAQELGHSGVQLLEERYGHLLSDRRRLRYVEY